MESEKLARLCHEYADNKKAEDIVVLDLRGVADVTDFFVIASGSSDPHLRAIVNELEGGLKARHDTKCHRIDGDHHSGWIAMDYIDVIVHIMREDMRAKYDLEGLWSDAPRLELATAEVR
ncbi:MAG: ribosome silencing factor [Verrucomicrobiales bacterium]|nr:ribosome silencing factor [Verrucomicrobiales bacterium]